MIHQLHIHVPVMWNKVVEVIQQAYRHNYLNQIQRHTLVLRVCDAQTVLVVSRNTCKFGVF